MSNSLKVFINMETNINLYILSNVIQNTMKPKYIIISTNLNNLNHLKYYNIRTNRLIDNCINIINT